MSATGCGEHEVRDVRMRADDPVVVGRVRIPELHRGAWLSVDLLRNDRARAYQHSRVPEKGLLPMSG